MSEQIQYQNIFDFELKRKTGIVDVISKDRMPMEFTKHHTFRFTRDFVDELKKVCSCRSLSLALSWLIDDGMNCLERERKVLYIAPNGVTSVRHMDSYYIADARCREQFSIAKYYRFMMPVGVINRLNAMCIGTSKSVAAEAIAKDRMYRLREAGKTAVVRVTGC